MAGEQAWVTLATNDSYALGALVVARSLRRVNTLRKIVVMITPGVTGLMREALTSEFDIISEVNVLDSEDSANLALLTRPELGITFTKLHCWRLTEFTKCVFLDADTLILQNCDELFDREEFSAVPDVGWPDCFNSGVFVFKPSIETYNKLLAFAVSSGSFDGGDQGLLNLYFNDWSVSDISRHLPFIYNMVASATYSYLPAFRVFGANVKIAHFIGAEKPWLMYFDSATGTVRTPSGQEHLQELLQAWWDIFRADVHRKLSPEMGGDNNLSATVVEQVQDSFSHIYIAPPDPSASSFSSNFNYQAPPPPNPEFHPPFFQNTHDTETKSYHEHVEHKPMPPEFHWVSVAIERFTPEYVSNPPPPPPQTTEGPNPEIERYSQIQKEQQQSSSQPSSFHEISIPSVQNIKSESCSTENDGRKSDSEASSSAGLAGAFAKMSLEGEKSPQQIDFEEQMRKHAWESGHIDYLGKDSFDNIMKKIQASMSQATAAPEKPKEKSPSPPKVPKAVPVPEASAPAPEPQPGPTAPVSVSEPAPAVTAVPESQPATVSAPEPQQVAPSAPATVVEPQPTPAAPTPAVPEPQPTPAAPATVAEPKPTPAAPTPAVPEPKPTPAAPTPVVPQPEPAAVVPTATAVPTGPPEKASEELEEARLTAERQALEKKLSEQKRIAEQKLEQEKQAAVARAAAEAQKTVAPEPTAAVPAAAQSQPTPAAEEKPVAPPRRQSKVEEYAGGVRGLRWNNIGYRVGLGLSCLAVVAYAIYSASASTFPLIGEGHNYNED